MTRTVGNIGMPSDFRWPEDGQYECRCLSLEKTKSKGAKKTPVIILTWQTLTGAYKFADWVFVTSKTVQRLNMIAQRVCGMPPDTEIPEDEEIHVWFAQYIVGHIQGKSALITIESEYAPASEEDIIAGRKHGPLRHRVAFAGYDKLEDKEETDEYEESSIPF